MVEIFDKSSRLRQTQRLIAKVPSIAAYAYRHSVGRPYNYPDNELSFTGNFLNMLFKMTELKYQPNPVLVRALEGLTDAARIELMPDRSSLWAGLFDLRENLLGRALDDLRVLTVA